MGDTRVSVLVKRSFRGFLLFLRFLLLLVRGDALAECVAVLVWRWLICRLTPGPHALNPASRRCAVAFSKD
jgi:hypothetical protein